jgi:hypothetical protein
MDCMSKLRLAASVFVAIFATSVTAETIDGFTVKETQFPPVLLRYGEGYYFNVRMAVRNGDIYLQKFGASFTEGGDYNGTKDGGKQDPGFVWTKDVTDLDFYLPNRFEGKIIESNPDYYFIKHRPTERRANNLEVTYKIYTWFRPDKSTDWQKSQLRIDRQSYSITWCGDGVRDDYIDALNGKHVLEVCDPSDPNKVGWVGGACNSCN